MKNGRKTFDRPLLIPGEVVFRLDPFNRELFTWNELKRRILRKK